MKVAVECKSPLLQKSLELFLSSHLSSVKQCDVVVRDFKVDDEKSFYVGKEKDADLIKPFSKSALILALESRYENLNPKFEKKEKETLSQDDSNFHILEKRIDLLTKEYQQNILKVVKAFYEK